MILKALGIDYKNILVYADIYADWTRMLKALENAAQLNPLIVRNGEINKRAAAKLERLNRWLNASSDFSYTMEDREV